MAAHISMRSADGPQRPQADAAVLPLTGTVAFTSTDGSGTVSVLAADVNRDGIPDLLTATADGATLSLGTGGGAFGAPSIVSNPGATSIAVAVARATIAA